MKTKPTILKCTQVENSIELLLRMDADIHYFSGHFPKNPILPAVAQIDWVLFYAKQYLNASFFPFDGMEVIKFQTPILPNDEITLAVKWDEAKQKVYFSYTSDQNKYSSGRIKLSSANV
ncbi:MAG TPA: 3-hydroxyacyl-ACP dehydratase [Psychromonas hadalis]|nr:3-hydroxyacyl-ACP dehydratase [Psychromonas hadalis]